MTGFKFVLFLLYSPIALTLTFIEGFWKILKELVRGLKGLFWFGVVIAILITGVWFINTYIYDGLGTAIWIFISTLVVFSRGRRY